MFNFHRYRALLLHFNPPKPCPLLPFPFPSSLNLNLCTSTTTSQSESESFRVSYLINNLGFTPEAAHKASKKLHFNTPERPESFFNLFRSHGFSDSNIRHILRKEPWLLSSRPHISILPKFEFFLSKGASASDIVRLLTANPNTLRRNLENCIIPQHELFKRFLKSDKQTTAFIIRFSISLHYKAFMANLNLMIDYGVCDSSIAGLLLTRPRVLSSDNLLESLEEVKGLGFDPSKTTFGVALRALKVVTKNKWDEKVDTFKKWGWSHESVLRAFRKQPHMMLQSSDKINLVLSFWVNQMGWDSLALVKGPGIFAYNLQKRIIPRAAVLQFLLKKGLRKKNSSLIKPFSMPEEEFLNKFVLCFVEESACLLKLYKDKMSLASTKESTVIPLTKHVPP
ncbi:uncharacterized protein LOC130723266 [Lotus japonicus]|uniref:uncharacterized protein LOC130723266 n=1 Tax=Lotus japonicus TaxID=34305 RepID=UPI002587A452|nr:uncharacterized protein LOC130723266 [Lotus japonicus]